MSCADCKFPRAARRLRELERLAADEASAEAGASQAMLQRQAKLAWPLVRRMGEMLDALPRRATLSDWAHAVTRLAQASGMLQPLDASGTAENTVLADSNALADHRAWQQLIDALGESQRLNGWLGQRPTMLSRREFYEHLREMLRVEVLAAGNDEAGRVRVLGAESARHLSAPYVFIAGLSERSFPPPDRDDCLYSAAETGQLVAAGLPLVSASDRRAHEMLLFYEVATRATRRLVLSYPALDAAAQPMSPSPYLAEVERAFSAGAMPRSGPPDLSPLPSPGAVYCPRDLARARRGQRARRRRCAAGSARRAACDRAGRRQSVGSPGRLVAARRHDVRSLGRNSFVGRGAGNAQRSLWAGTLLESEPIGAIRLLSVPVFSARVLGIEAIEDPVLAVDYARRGQMLHWLLAALHRGLNETAGKRVSPGDLADRQLADRLAELAADLLVRGKSDRALSDGLLEVDVRRLLAWLDDYERQHEKYDKELQALDAPLRPAHFEVSFGPSRGAARENDELVDPLSTPEPFELECGGEQVRFAGRIDRIDLGRHDGQTVYGIIDYKSGRSDGAKISAIAEGLALQLPLYALAAEMMLGDRAIPLRVAYWHVAGPGCKESLDLHQIADGAIAPHGRMGIAQARVARPHSFAGQGNSPGPVPHVQRRRQVHQQLRLQHGLPRQPGALAGQAMATAARGQAMSGTEIDPLLGLDRAAAGGHRDARRVGVAVGRGGLRQDVRADRAILVVFRCPAMPARFGPMSCITWWRSRLPSARPARCAIGCGARAIRVCRSRPRPRRTKANIGPHWSALSTALASARSTRSARRCCDRMRSKPASIRSFEVLEQAQAETLLAEAVDDELRRLLSAARSADDRAGRELRRAGTGRHVAHAGQRGTRGRFRAPGWRRARPTRCGLGKRFNANESGPRRCVASPSRRRRGRF